MRLYTINKDYIDYLKEFDDKVVNVDYNDRFKLFVGKIKLQNNNEAIGYYIPLTSFKEKFDDNNEERLDIFRIKDARNNHFTGVLNINNMIPVPDIAVSEFGYDMLRYNEAFPTRHDKDAYYQLTLNELTYINDNKDTIENKAKIVFSLVNDNNQKFQQLSDICCDFVELYKHAIEYNDILTKEVETLMNHITNEFKNIENDFNSSNVTHYSNNKTK